MAYIRTNEDYYRSLGMSTENAKVQVEMDKRGVDAGYCNPRKAKEYAQVENEVKAQVKKDMKKGV